MKKCKEEKNRRLGDMETAEVTKRKADVITKARNKLLTLSDSLKSNKHVDLPDQAKKGVSKSMTQVTLDYFSKHFPPNKNHIFANTRINDIKGKSLIKQNSIGSYPIKIEITDEDKYQKNTINRLRPATVCVDKLNGQRNTEALALERPRKKLSFKVPEITNCAKKNNNKINGDKDKSGSLNCIAKLNLSVLDSAGIPRNRSFNGVLHRENSWEDVDLEVRIIFCIFAPNICFKLFE